MPFCIKVGEMWQKAGEEENASSAVCPPPAQTLTSLRMILSASVVDMALASQLTCVLFHEGG